MQPASYRLSSDTLGISDKNHWSTLITIPKGASVRIVDAPVGSRLIDVLWEGEAVKIFTQDLDERGVLEEPGAGAEAPFSVEERPEPKAGKPVQEQHRSKTA